MEETSSSETNGLTTNKLWIYPNPVNSSLFVTLSEELSGADIRVISVIGEIIRQESAIDLNVHIDMSDMPAGTYIVSVRKNEVNLSQRIAKR